MTHRIAATLVLTAAIIACAGDDAARGDSDASDTSDADTGASDALDDADVGDVPPTCAALAPLDETLPLDPDGATTQIHASAAFDGDGIWIAYDVPPDGGDGFEVWLTRIGCDGMVTHPPSRIDTTDGVLALQPRVAVGHGRVLVAWHVDDSTPPFNLSIHTRALELDGTPVGDQDRRLELTRLGEPHAGNVWMPAITVAEEGFLLAGAWGHDDAPGFQAFVQALDLDGAPVGDAADVALDPSVGQVNPSVASDDEGWSVGFLASTADTDVSTIVVQAAGDAVPVALPDGAAGEPAVASAASTRLATVAVEAGRGADIAAFEFDSDGNAFEAVTTGVPGRLNHSPTVAIDPDGQTALLGWYVVRTGFSNDVGFAKLERSESDAWTVGEHALLPLTSAAAPYALAVTPIGDGKWFIAWSEGTSPDLRLFGRFVAP